MKPAYGCSRRGTPLAPMTFVKAKTFWISLGFLALGGFMVLPMVRPSTLENFKTSHG